MRIALAVLALACGARGGLAETVILQLHVVKGERAVFTAGARAVKPVAVRVTDETGAPVAKAAVTFRLPEEGVSGVFQNGLKTDLVLSNQAGLAESPNIAWGPLAGAARLRVTAVLDRARAATLVSVFVTATGANVAVAPSTASAGALAPIAVLEPATVAATRPPVTPSLKPKRAWVKWAAAAAAGVAGAVLFTYARPPSGASSPTAGVPVLTVGAPTITIGPKP